MPEHLKELVLGLALAGVVCFLAFQIVSCEVDKHKAYVECLKTSPAIDCTRLLAN